MKYTVEFTRTIEVDAEDSIEAFDKAYDIAKDFDVDDYYIYVDGNLYN